jgi:phosphoglycerate dehydrogenase-like enzyme
MPDRKIIFLPRTTLAADILSERAKAILTSLGSVVWNERETDWTPAELAAELPGADAVITSWNTPALTPELLAVADKLKIVGHAAGSVKRLLPPEGWARGIVVVSSAALIADSVAEYTLWAMLTMQRDLFRYERLMKVERGWKTAQQDYGHEVYFKKVGIVSASMVGRRVINLLKPFRCDVRVYDPYLSDEEAGRLGVRKASLEELFAECDIVSVHAPTTPETKRMITGAHFRSLQDGALFVNTARTWVLDQDALVAELQTGRIRAAIDVFDQEPLPPDHPIRDLDNVFLSPHISAYTAESRLRLVEGVAEDMRRFFAGEPLQLAVPPERLAIMA